MSKLGKAEFLNNLGFWVSRATGYPLVSPEVLQISLTYRCNLRCEMCSIAELLPVDEELSTDRILRIIDQAVDYKIRQVLLTGGEPFLREDIFKLSGYCRDKGLVSVVTTNGTLINKGVADSIANSGINHIHISLDGLEETNNSLRGKGSFRKVIDAIEILNNVRGKDRAFSIGIACTVMDRNIRELYDIVELADRMKVDVINFQPLIKDNANFLDTGLPAFWVKEEEIPILREEIGKIKRYRPEHILIQEEPGLELLVKYYDRQLTHRDWRCFGGFKTVFICYSKNEPLVYTCHGICGNLNLTSLKNAWRSKEARSLRAHSKKCRNLCMQSCYSKKSAQSLARALRDYVKDR